MAIVRGTEVESVSIPGSAPFWFHIRESPDIRYWTTGTRFPDLKAYDRSTGELLVLYHRQP